MCITNQTLRESSPTNNFAFISRRNFVKLTAAGLLGLVWPKRISRLLLPLSNQQGRVIPETLTLYQNPSFLSPPVKDYGKDTILTLTLVTIGDGEPPHNRVWYKIGQEGYAHSGSIQPVQTRLNEPQENLPNQGALAEVTVPFTDAHSHPGNHYSVVYRFYYETTHWVDKLLVDREQKLWYRIREDRWKLIYYVAAEHLRVIPLQELELTSKNVPDTEKRISINLEKQIVTAFEYENPVFMTRASTGARFSNGNFSTPVGAHMTFHKRPSRHMAAGNLAANGYDLPGVPWVSYITEKGVAIHGTYWHNDYGRPRSHGCINLTPQASKWIYLWTSPFVPPQQQRIYERTGTRVDVI